MIRFILGIITLLISNTLFAQVSDELTGTVSAKDKRATVELVGANVYWANTSHGTITDENGKFSIPFVDDLNLLVVSYIGYVSDTIEIQKKKNIDVTLLPDQQLDEVKVAGKKPGAHLSRLDPIATINVTGEELCKAACCNLSESFETNASVDVAYSDAATGAKQIQLLGLSGNYVQMMTENIPNFRGLATPYGLTYIPGTWMESIQISKGTSTVVNGFEALTGQINVEYKKPLDSELFYINLFGSDMGRAEANVNGSIHINEKLKTAVFAHYSKDMVSNDLNDDGFRDEPLLSQVNVMNRWDYNNLKGFTSQLGVKLIDEERLGGEMEFDSNKPSDEYYGINIKTKRFEAFGKAGFIFNDKVSSIGLVANWSHHKQNSFYGLRTYDASQNSIYANLIFQSIIVNPNNKFTTGLSLQADNYDEIIAMDYRQQNNMNFLRDEFVPGLFFQYTYSLPERLTLIAGLRVDNHNQYGSFITPRLHVKYNVLPNTIIRASLGKGYRSPNVLAENSYLLASSRELNVSDDIEMEEAWNYGANITQYININDKELTVNAEFYRTSFVNQLVVDAEDVRSIYFYNSKGNAYANNFQIEAKYELFRGMDVVGAYRINDVKVAYADGIKIRPLMSKYKGLLTLSYATPLKKWQFDYTLQMNGGGRVQSTAANTAPNQRANYFDPYEIMNLQVTKYFRKWNMYLGAENIANFRQDNPIIAGDDPFGPEFDSSLTWGPVLGRRIYIGLRYFIDRE